MSVAAKKRAEAEAMFAKIAPKALATQPKSQEPEKLAEARQRVYHGGVRISERDSLTTQLRLADVQKEAYDAAQALADRFRLPPDQNLLLKVIGLDDADLTKLALEELLELEDRGRVRPTSELKTALGELHGHDGETNELKDLLLEKIRRA